MPNYKLITCIIPDKIPSSILEKLKTEKKIITANKNSARGASSKSSYQMREMEVLRVVVEESRADEIFEYLYYLLEMDQPNRGIMHQIALGRMTDYTLPNL